MEKPLVEELKAEAEETKPALSLAKSIAKQLLLKNGFDSLNDRADLTISDKTNTLKSY